MKKLSTVLSVVFLIGVMSAVACNKPSAVIRDSGIPAAGKRVVLEVPTITCTGCWPRVEASARSVAGVIDVKFDSKIVQRVTIVYDPEKTNGTAIIAAIEMNGDKAIGLSE